MQNFVKVYYLVPEKMNNMESCIFCTETAMLNCSSCKTLYCSDEHMKLHIDETNGDCFPFQIKQTEGVGR